MEKKIEFCSKGQAAPLVLLGMLLIFFVFLQAISTIVPKLEESNEFQTTDTTPEEVIKDAEQLAYEAIVDTSQRGGNEAELEEELRKKLASKEFELVSVEEVDWYPRINVSHERLNFTFTLDLWKARFYLLNQYAEELKGEEKGLGKEFRGVLREKFVEALQKEGFSEFNDYTDGKGENCKLELELEGEEPSPNLLGVNPLDLLEVFWSSLNFTQRALVNHSEAFKALERDEIALVVIGFLRSADISSRGIHNQEEIEACVEQCKSGCSNCPDTCPYGCSSQEDCERFCECWCDVRRTGLSVLGRFEVNLTPQLYERAKLEWEQGLVVRLNPSYALTLLPNSHFYYTTNFELSCEFNVTYWKEGVYYNLSLADESSCSCELVERTDLPSAEVFPPSPGCPFDPRI